MSDETAAALDGGPGGPADATWLILQRLDDLRRGQDQLRGEMATLRTEVRGEIGGLHGEMAALRTEVRGEIDGLRGEVRDDIRSLRQDLNSWRAWTIGVLLLAVLSLTVKLFLPSL